MKKFILVSSLFSLLLLFACKKQNDDPTTSNNRIKNGEISVTFSNRNLSRTGWYKFENGQPTFEGSIELKDNERLRFDVYITGELSNQEIKANAEVYQLFFSGNAIQKGHIHSFLYSDTDKNGGRIGLIGSISTGERTGSGNYTELIVSVVKNPLKNALGVKEGQIQNAGGQVVFEGKFKVSVF